MQADGSLVVLETRRAARPVQACLQQILLTADEQTAVRLIWIAHGTRDSDLAHQ